MTSLRQRIRSQGKALAKMEVRASRPLANLSLSAEPNSGA
jgi:hypothetical protein